jgi:hypothetical protein
VIPSPAFPTTEAVTIMFVFGVVIAIGILRSFGGAFCGCGTPDERYSLANAMPASFLANAMPASFLSVLNLALFRHLVMSHVALLLYAFPSTVAKSHSSKAVH